LPALLGLSAATAQPPGPYSQLQILLPGETAAPETGTGKLGVPLDQTAGMPFQITVRACDADWNTVGSISHVVEIASTDESASLPEPVSLVDGETVLTVALNAGGSFTVSVNDPTHPSIPQALSSPLRAIVRQGFEFGRIHHKTHQPEEPVRRRADGNQPLGG
jgi:hypothetical protein